MLQSGKLKNLVNRSVAKASQIRYHHISNKIAFNALKEIEKQKGKLISKTRKLSDEYATDILGWKGFAPWLYVYSAVRGSFKEGWIPDNYYGKVVIPKIQGDYGKISFLKPLCNRLFEKQFCPDIVSFINGFWFDKNLKPISTENLSKIIFADTDSVVCKLDQSYQGRGVFQYGKRDLDTELIEKRGNCVIQKHIQQHPFFDAFLLKAVATIRMTTVIDNKNDITVRACYLRLGRINDTHVKSISHIRIPVNIKDGTLYEQGYLANWQIINTHPDSKVAFSNKTVPQFKECVQLVLKLHERMPMVRCIGWDVIVDKEDDPILMEWNGYSNDIKFSEATQGPCFKDLNWNLLS